MVCSQDPQVNQELGWKAIRKWVKSIKKEWEETKGSRIHPEDQLFDLHAAMCLSSDPELIAKMKILEDEVRRIEHQSTILQHIRRCFTWLKIGDALIQYFFKLVTTKCIRESIKILSLPDGRLTKDESEILNGVYSHYRLLYKRDPKVSRFNVVWTEVLKLITKTFSTIDNRKLQEPPTDGEIERIVLGFPKEKSPRGDGVTYDFLQGYWDFMGDCCEKMVLAVQCNAKLSHNIINGIIKMTPKRNDQLEFLDYWRNLTMLTTIYKVISKILAKRFKPIVPKIVNP